MPGPLSGLRVIELGGIGPVPHAGMMLADMGADVIQVVRPGTEPDPTDVLSRGKRSVCVDLKASEGAALIGQMAGQADVLIEGFRPGVAERLGVGPDACLEANRRLVYGRMTGFGQDGPLAAMAGHDIDYIAVSGVLASIGPPERPLPPLNLVGDFGGGSMLLLVGVLAALHTVARTDEGQVVDASMIDGSALLMAMHHGAMAGGWWSAERGANLFDGTAPFYSTYATADRKWVAVGALEPHFFADLLDRLDIDASELASQMDRDGWPAMRERFAATFRSRTRRQWEEIFAGSDACVVGVYDMEEAAGHPQNRARGVFVEVDGLRQPAPAPRFSGTPSADPGEVPRPGEHTFEVLAELGVDPGEIDRLRDGGTVQG